MANTPLASENKDDETGTQVQRDLPALVENTGAQRAKAQQAVHPNHVKR